MSGPLGAVGTEMVEWLVANASVISDLAPGWGDAFQAWISPILAQAKEALDGVKWIKDKRKT